MAPQARPHPLTRGDDTTVCSYGGCSSVESIGWFMTEHDLLVDATGVLRRACATGDQDAVVAAADALADIRSGAHGRATELEHALRSHIDHEDNCLFPAAAIRFAGPEWDRAHELTPPPAAPTATA